MEPTAQPEQSAPYKPGMPNRRQRKPDVWARVFRYLTVLVYPLLILCILIFVGFGNADRDRALTAKLGGAAAAEAAGGGRGDLFAVLPILVLGALVGGVGLALNGKRARRRSDYNYRTQLVLTMLSVGGLLVFFLLR